MCKETQKITEKTSVIEGKIPYPTTPVEYSISYKEVFSNTAPKEIGVEVDFDKNVFCADPEALKTIIKNYIAFHVSKDQMDFRHRMGIGKKIEDFLIEQEESSRGEIWGRSPNNYLKNFSVKITEQRSFE